jgi:excisionase family DNA binding protein
MATPTVPIDGWGDALAISVRQAARSAGVSRSILYEEMHNGRLKFVKIGARRVILVDDLREWLVTLRDGAR